MTTGEIQTCECCGRKLNPKTMVWLELSTHTGQWHDDVTPCPPEESQGWFAFGAACARKIIRQRRQESRK